MKREKTNKKLLLLGGSAQQIIAINTAKRMGLYTVLCDYLPDNPGQYHADKFYQVSTTDKNAILEVARQEGIDGILAYASDPAAPTAAFVAEKLGLPGNPYESVEILCNKDRFRQFLSDNGFNTPLAKGYDSIASAIDDIQSNYFTLPLIVKPVDSSGSKGVSRIDKTEDVESKLVYAMSFSRTKRVIVEEYVEKYGYQIAGDGLSVEGKLVFRCFANDHFDARSTNPFVPVSASFPYNMPKEVQDKIHSEIQRLITLLKMGTTTYNFDLRIDKDYHVFLMEVAPRDGGNYIPDIIKNATGVDLVECSIRAAIGESIIIPGTSEHNGFWSYYAVHSYESGILDCIQINPDVEKNNIIEKHLIYKPGDNIQAFTGANTTLGILIMRFDNMEQMLHMMDHSEEWIKVIIKKANNNMKYIRLRSAETIQECLYQFTDCYPRLVRRGIIIQEYAKKMADSGWTLAYKDHDKIKGIICFYANDLKSFTGYVSLIWIKQENRHEGIGSKLMDYCLKIMEIEGMKKVELEVRNDNISAISFYRKHGFIKSNRNNAEKMYMNRCLKPSQQKKRPEEQYNG